MKKQITLNACDFCYNAHMDNFGNDENFDLYEKAETKKCLACGGAMCKTCVSHSQKKTTGTPFSELGMVLCGGCLMQHRHKGSFKKYVLQCYLKQKEAMQNRIVALCRNYFKKGGKLTLPLLTMGELTALRKENLQNIQLIDTKIELKDLSNTIDI